MPTSEPLTAYSTIQFHRGGLFDSTPTSDLIHLVTATESGGHGPIVCGIDRFADMNRGWSIGGGVTGEGIDPKPCPDCDEWRDRALPVHGLFAPVFTSPGVPTVHDRAGEHDG